ncbi:hypothetical protein IC582_006908 [Cucumis melo]
MVLAQKKTRFSNQFLSNLVKQRRLRGQREFPSSYLLLSKSEALRKNLGN